MLSGTAHIRFATAMTTHTDPHNGSFPNLPGLHSCLQELGYQANGLFEWPTDNGSEIYATVAKHWQEFHKQHILGVQ